MGLEYETDLLMVVTSFGIFVYSTFTIIAGSLSDSSSEPRELVIVNGLAELLQVQYKGIVGLPKIPHVLSR